MARTVDPFPALCADATQGGQARRWNHGSRGPRSATAAALLLAVACAANPDGVQAIADAVPAQRDTALVDVTVVPVPSDSEPPDARVAPPDLATSVDASQLPDALPIPGPDATPDACVCEDAGRQLYDGSMCPTSEYFMACICEQFVMHCEFVVDPGCPGSSCGDDVELTCCGVPPTCPEGEVVTRRNGCWACVTVAECEATRRH